MIRDQVAEILFNEPVSPGYFRMRLVASGYENAVPGQFVMLGLGKGVDPLLRRPFSIHRLHGPEYGGIDILYKVVGKATRMMGDLEKGAKLRLLGPLGRGFRPGMNAGRHYLVAGGIGVAPLLFLGEYLVKKGIPPENCKLFLGGRSSSDILCAEDFVKLGMDLVLTTDDGSAGRMCLVTEPLWRASEPRPDIIYACGPAPMLRSIAARAESENIPCQVSVEEKMACGIGACLGCAVESRKKDSYLHACKNGPVFDSWEIIL